MQTVTVTLKNKSVVFLGNEADAKRGHAGEPATPEKGLKVPLSVWRVALALCERQGFRAGRGRDFLRGQAQALATLLQRALDGEVETAQGRGKVRTRGGDMLGDFLKEPASRKWLEKIITYVNKGTGGLEVVE